MNQTKMTEKGTMNLMTEIDWDFCLVEFPFVKVSISF